MPDSNPFAASLRSGLLSIAAAGALAAAGAAAPQSEAEELWNDPTFQKQFVAGYGINAEIEPRVTPDEVEILEKVRPLMAKDLAKAEAALKKAMKPNCSAVLDFTLGSLQFQQDRVPEALDTYNRAVAKFPSFRRAWKNLGILQAKRGNHDAAIHAFIRMIELGGGDALSYGLLGMAYAAKQDYQPAEIAYRNALLLQPDSTDLRLGLTRCVLRQEKFEDCASLLDVLIAKYPEKAEFWMLQAHAFRGMKQPLRAAQNFEVVDLLGKATVESSHMLGDIYVAENLLDLALRAYERAIAIDASQPTARPLRSAELLVSRGGSPQARRLAASIHKAFDARLDDPSRTKLLMLEARISMAEDGGSPETARILEEIVKINPLDGDALMLLGQHYSRHQEPERAIFYYERAEGLEAFEANAKLRHAQVLVALGRYSDATPLLRRAQEARPREDVARYLEQVERMARAQR